MPLPRSALPLMVLGPQPTPLGPGMFALLRAWAMARGDWLLAKSWKMRRTVSASSGSRWVCSPRMDGCGWEEVCHLLYQGFVGVDGPTASNVPIWGRTTNPMKGPPDGI